MKTLNLCAPKGQQVHSPGQHLGIGAPPIYTPCKGKSIFIFPYATNLLSLQGEYTMLMCYPGCCPGLCTCCPFRAFRRSCSTYFRHFKYLHYVCKSNI